MSVAPLLSAQCVGWARAAGYSHVVDDSAATTVLSSHSGRYFLRLRSRGRVEISEADDDPDDRTGSQERTIVFAADVGVAERCLYGLCGDDLRDDVGLPYLDLPFAEEDLAGGFDLTEVSGTYRLLRHVTFGVRAAAPDSAAGMATLVPLSHLLSISEDDVRRSFLSETGAPLLDASGRYGPR
ncbi:Imm61 family immunity protein [Mycolicibacterium alvei]|uniref:Uncharacterized protein n=1 Tax=Mycolicibacterium alvei TaxID=67081 RepID=A0A6N4V3U1_9MYCO|nr:Imm61 family immunity protein [Mycolicibacterium alvei]MCV7003610.1 hypothetical protein [Mycolicibacterium alvei]BBX30432.1 hypothetical protein MALV_55570 [Mycolicibacterium alvei]